MFVIRQRAAGITWNKVAHNNEITRGVCLSNEKIIEFLQTKFERPVTLHGFAPYAKSILPDDTFESFAGQVPEGIIGLELKKKDNCPLSQLCVTLNVSNRQVVIYPLLSGRELDKSNTLPPTQIMPPELFLLLRSVATAIEVKRYGHHVEEVSVQAVMELFNEMVDAQRNAGNKAAALDLSTKPVGEVVEGDLAAPNAPPVLSAKRRRVNEANLRVKHQRPDEEIQVINIDTECRTRPASAPPAIVSSAPGTITQSPALVDTNPAIGNELHIAAVPLVNSEPVPSTVIPRVPSVYADPPIRRGLNIDAEIPGGARFRQKLFQALLKYLNARSLKMDFGYSLAISGFEHMDQQPPASCKKYVHLEFSRRQDGVVIVTIHKFVQGPKNLHGICTRELEMTKKNSEWMWLFDGMRHARNFVNIPKPEALSKYRTTDVRNTIARKHFNPRMVGLELGEKAYACTGNVISAGAPIQAVCLSALPPDSVFAVSANGRSIPQPQ